MVFHVDKPTAIDTPSGKFRLNLEGKYLMNILVRWLNQGIAQIKHYI